MPRRFGQSAAPESPPVSARIAKANGSVRFGVPGSLSKTNSPTAIADKTEATACLLRNARESLRGLIQFRVAAQLTTAGAVIERSPATTPIPRASRIAFGSVLVKGWRRGHMLFAMLPSMHPPRTTTAGHLLTPVPSAILAAYARTDSGAGPCGN